MDKQHNETLTQHDGYMLHPTATSKINVPHFLFYCSDNLYIDETLICNGIKDCATGTDEEHCICEQHSLLSTSICKFINTNGNKEYTCSDFFYKCLSSLICIPFLFVCDGHRDCPQGEDEFCIQYSNAEHGLSDTYEAILFKCTKNNRFVPLQFGNDLIPDCPDSFDDEVEYFNLLTSSYHLPNSCNSTYELSCIPDHSHCFPLNKLCMYDFEKSSMQLKYCRNGAHLHNCTNFKCLGSFKYPLSYCIEFDLVCNGNWDCPRGYDEQICMNYTCPYLFKCQRQSKCIPLSKVCDKSKDCVYHDDELSCITGYFLSCPLECTCFSQSIICNNLKYFSVHQSIWTFVKYFKCYSCSFQFREFPLSISVGITLLHIREHPKSHTCISREKHNSLLSSLREIDIASNRLITIKDGCFLSLKSLTILDLQNNTISVIEDQSFISLCNLLTLNLSKIKLKHWEIKYLMV